MPGDTAVKIQQTKEPEQKNDFDEWLARIICYAFSVPPQWAVKLMNRATADNQSAQAEEEGLEPTKAWVKDLVDQIIAEEFASPDLELVWLSQEDNDLGKNEAALEARVKLGALTLNELRDALGLDPYANPAADRPMVLTATGYVPIEAGTGGGTAHPPAKLPSVARMSEAKSGNGSIAGLAKDYDPNQPRVPAGNSDGGQWTSGNGDAASGSSADGSETNDGVAPASIGQPVRYAALDTGARTDAADGDTTDSSSGGNSSNSNAEFAQNKVTPHGFTVEHIPGTNPLDPQQLNTPISADEMQKIANALTLKENGDTGALQLHVYRNLPHYLTGAVLPDSAAGYTAYDVPGLGPGRGEGRLVVDNATGAMYYTNNHYYSFYAIQMNRDGSE